MRTICIAFTVTAMMFATAQTNRGQSNQTQISISPSNSIPAASTNHLGEPRLQEGEQYERQSPLNDESFAAHISRDARTTPVISNELKPNEITVGKLTLSGIAVQMATTANPLQLVNPFAPPEYGSSELNLVRDPIHRKPMGLRIFSLQF